MLDPEITKRLDELQAFSRNFKRQGRTRNEFWEEFSALAGDLEVVAFSDDADPALRSRYLDILADADDAGLSGPPEVMDDRME